MCRWTKTTQLEERQPVQSFRKEVQRKGEQSGSLRPDLEDLAVCKEAFLAWPEHPINCNMAPIWHRYVNLFANILLSRKNRHKDRIGR